MSCKVQTHNEKHVSSRYIHTDAAFTDKRKSSELSKDFENDSFENHLNEFQKGCWIEICLKCQTNFKGGGGEICLRFQSNFEGLV